MIFSNLFLNKADAAPDNDTNNVDRCGDKGERGCADYEAYQATEEACFATRKDTKKGHNEHGKEGYGEHQRAPNGMSFPYPSILHHLGLMYGGVVDVGPNDKFHSVEDIGEDIGSKKCRVLKVKDETISSLPI